MKRKLKPRCIEEPWSVSMWEPPQLVEGYVLRNRLIDEKGNQTIKFEKVKIVNEQFKRKNRLGT